MGYLSFLLEERFVTNLTLKGLLLFMNKEKSAKILRCHDLEKKCHKTHIQRASSLHKQSKECKNFEIEMIQKKIITNLTFLGFFPSWQNHLNSFGLAFGRN